ncbi:unnamed protein product, partial [marine sediment metagenome]
ELQTAITNRCDIVAVENPRIPTFFNGYDGYTLEEYTNRSKSQMVADMPKTATFEVGLRGVIVRPNIDNLSKLALLAVDRPNPITYLTPIMLMLFPEYNTALRINNWLDAASYAARNIHYSTGESMSWDDTEKRVLIAQFMKRVNDYSGMKFPSEIQDYVTEMKETANYVTSNLATEDPVVIGQYIDASVPKLPLMRRLWALEL